MISRARRSAASWWETVTGPTRVAFLVIGVRLGVTAWLVLPGAYWQDDFAFLLRAREQGLTWDYLTHTHNGHIIPIPFLMSWVLTHSNSYLPAGLLTLALTALVSVAMWFMLHRIVGPTPAMATGLAVALLSPLMFSTVTWWAAGPMMLGLQLAMALAATAHVEFQRTRRWRWLLAAVLAYLLGLAFWEKSILIPAFLVLVTLLVSGGVRETVRTGFRLWPAWVAYAITAGAYLTVYLPVASIGDRQVRTVGALLSLVRHQIIDVFFRGLFGGPWHALSGDSSNWLEASVLGLVVLAQLLIAFGVLAYWLSGPRSLVCWAAVLFYLGLDVALTAKGRGVFAGLVQMDPRYVCDAIPLVALCVAVMLTPRAGRELVLPTWLRPRTWVVALAAAVVLFNSSMVTAEGMAPDLHREQVRRYVANARAALAEDPRLVLYDGFVPGTIMIGAFPAKDKRVSTILDSYGVKPRYDVPSEDMRALDDKGRPRKIWLTFPQAAKIDQSNTCGVRLDSTTRQDRVSIGAPIGTGTWIMKVEYFSGSDTVIDVVTTGEPRPVGLVAGQHSIYIPVEGGTSTVQLRWLRGEDAVCVTGLTVGLPAPVPS